MNHDASHRYEWKTIPWRKLEVRVFKLQRRISQATLRGETQKARSLQKLLAASWSAKSLAMRRVTQENKGKKGTFQKGAKVVNSLSGETLCIPVYGAINCQLEFERCPIFCTCSYTFVQYSGVMSFLNDASRC